MKIPKGKSESVNRRKTHTTQWPKDGQTTQWSKDGHTTQWPKDGQTTQWPKEKGQKDKQRSTKRTYKTKDWVTRTPLKTNNDLQNIHIKLKME